MRARASRDWALRAGGGALLLLILSAGGCATAVKQTTVAESALAELVSAGYRTFGQVDGAKMNQIAATVASGHAASARALLEAYRPRRDKALGALDAAADLIVAADQARGALQKGSATPADYAAYLPQLAAAFASVKQALVELGVKP